MLKASSLGLRTKVQRYERFKKVPVNDIHYLWTILLFNMHVLHGIHFANTTITTTKNKKQNKIKEEQHR